MGFTDAIVRYLRDAWRERYVTEDDGTRRIRVRFPWGGHVDFFSFHLGDYMRRWIVQTDSGGSIHLHKILRSDNDRAPHNHPWNFVSIVLWGGYHEELYDARRHRGIGPAWDVRLTGVLNRRPLTARYIDAKTLHKVKLRGRPAWTLCITGPKVKVLGKVKSWGFQTERGWVHHRDYRTKEAQ